ncbi:hypothetical protein J3U99_20400 [Brucella pituitosa]|uniref:hypothetical protein n=1 Tax=Brucella pituitosa TaxID=571256 RepID=UPI0020034E5C|nr:hypothetical protein [Brucella pituitosa]MCK4207134.1 hypothetical protein [Brucella pituitosa]
MRKPEIPTDIRVHIDKLLEQSGQQFSSGELQASLRTALQAWELIPEPKEKWDYYPQSLSSGFVIDFADLGDKESCLRWIETMALMYNDPNREDHQVLMQEGEAMYKLDDTDRAFLAFARIEEIYGRKGFAGPQKAYLKFLDRERARRAVGDF